MLVKSDNDISLLQNDLLKLEEWQNTWRMKLNPTKCFTMTLASRKPTLNLYTFCGQKLISVRSQFYLGEQISNTLNWTAQCNPVARKSTTGTRVIRRNLKKIPTHITSIAYTTLVRPILEYASASWEPHCLKHIKTLERIQRQAARFCTQNYSRERGTVTQLLKDIQWDTLQTRRKIKRLSIIYKMEHNRIDIPLDHYIQHNTRSSRKHDSSCKLDTLQTYLETVSSQQQLTNGILCLQTIDVLRKSINSFQNNLIQHFNN